MSNYPDNITDTKHNPNNPLYIGSKTQYEICELVTEDQVTIVDDEELHDCITTDVIPTGYVIFVRDTDQHGNTIATIKRLGYLKDTRTRDIEVVNDGLDTIWLDDTATGQNLLQLRRV